MKQNCELVNLIQKLIFELNDKKEIKRLKNMALGEGCDFIVIQYDNIETAWSKIIQKQEEYSSILHFKNDDDKVYISCAKYSQPTMRLFFLTRSCGKHMGVKPHKNKKSNSDENIFDEIATAIDRSFAYIVLFFIMHAAAVSLLVSIKCISINSMVCWIFSIFAIILICATQLIMKHPSLASKNNDKDYMTIILGLISAVASSSASDYIVSLFSSQQAEPTVTQLTNMIAKLT